jgi:enterobactin synthetase component D
MVTDMAIAPALYRETVSGDPPEAIWPWQNEARNCHCVTLRYSPEYLSAGYDVPLPAQLLRAAPRRKAEFIAGRRCAAAAIRHLTGRAAFPGMGEDRAPIWPEGVAGAISHSRDRAMAIAGFSSRFCGIGIDIERFLNEEEARDIAPLALTANESHSLGKDIDPFMTGLIFSAKESLFKALYPTVKRFFFFEAAELSDYDEGGAASLRLTTDISGKWRRGTEIPFRFCRFEGFLLTRILLPH